MLLIEEQSHPAGHSRKPRLRMGTLDLNRDVVRSLLWIERSYAIGHLSY